MNTSFQNLYSKAAANPDANLFVDKKGIGMGNFKGRSVENSKFVATNANQAGQIFFKDLVQQFGLSIALLSLQGALQGGTLALSRGTPLSGREVAAVLSKAAEHANASSAQFYNELKEQFGSKIALAALDVLEGETKALSRGTPLTPQERTSVNQKAAELKIEAFVHPKAKELGEDKGPGVSRLFHNFLISRDDPKMPKSTLEQYWSMALNLHNLKETDPIGAYFTELSIDENLKNKEWKPTDANFNSCVQAGKNKAHRNNFSSINGFRTGVKGASSISIDPQASRKEGTPEARNANRATAVALTISLKQHVHNTIVSQLTQANKDTSGNEILAHEQIEIYATARANALIKEFAFGITLDDGGFDTSFIEAANNGAPLLADTVEATINAADRLVGDVGEKQETIVADLKTLQDWLQASTDKVKKAENPKQELSSITTSSEYKTFNKNRHLETVFEPAILELKHFVENFRQ